MKEEKLTANLVRLLELALPAQQMCKVCREEVLTLPDEKKYGICRPCGSSLRGGVK